MVYEEGKTCDYCGIHSQHLSTIGKLDDPNWTRNICQFCYYHIAQLRESYFKWESEYIKYEIEQLSKVKQTQRVLFAIEKYKERLQDA